jgi:hypothetical protein
MIEGTGSELCGGPPKILIVEGTADRGTYGWGLVIIVKGYKVGHLQDEHGVFWDKPWEATSFKIVSDHVTPHASYQIVRSSKISKKRCKRLRFALYDDFSRLERYRRLDFAKRPKATVRTGLSTSAVRSYPRTDVFRSCG